MQKKEKPEYMITYNKTLGDIRNSYYYNFLSNLVELRDKLNLDENMQDDIYERANMFGNILMSIARVGDYPLPVGQALGDAHLIIHEEIARVPQYEEIILKVLSEFKNQHYSMLALVSPFTCYLLTEFNEDIRYHLAANLLLLSHRYNIELVWGETDSANVSVCVDKVRDIAMIGLPKMWNIANKLVGIVPDEQIVDVLKSHFKVENSETDVYADTVAFYVNSATIISDEIRSVFVLMQELKRRNYRIVLYHSQIGYQPETLAKVVDHSVYLPATFNKLATEKLAKRRYRAFFYTTNNIWSLYSVMAEIGDYNIAIGVSCYGCDMYLSGSGSHAVDYSQLFGSDKATINLHGVGRGMTVIVPNSLDEVKKVEAHASTKYVLLPWSIDDLTESNVNLMQSIGDSALFFYCSTNLQDYVSRLETIRHLVPNAVVIHSVGEYFSTYPAIDSVVFASPRLNLVLDALYFKKPITLLFDKDNSYLSSIGYDSNGSDINEIANQHNDSLCSSFWEFCSSRLDMTDRTAPKPKKMIPDY